MHIFIIWKHTQNKTKNKKLVGEKESVAFIDIPPNNLSKLPEKGILKKPYGSIGESKEKWSEDSQSDNQEILSQSDNNVGDVSHLFKQKKYVVNF